MGPFMVEIVFCRVTRRGRKLRKGMNKAGRANMRNDGPSMSFIPPEDTVKVTLDLSESGPVFSAMDEMMMKMLDDDAKDRKKNAGAGAAKDSLKKLLRSGIPGVEKMFAAPADPNAPGGKKGAQKGFHKMNDGSKKKFMTAIFGEDGTSVATETAAALLVATCAGGDPAIADNIAKLIIPELGETIDPAMMAALMSSCSMINAGAGTEEVLKAMKAELAASGLSEEDILKKAQMLMKAFGREDSSSMAEFSLASAQKNAALKQNGTSPKDFAQAVMLQKAIAACGATPENFAKIIMIENQLYKRGAATRDIAHSLKELGDFESKKEQVHSNILNALKEEKLQKNDVFMNVRMAQALDNENDTNWKEVKGMKDILQGCSPNSPEAISLNLARATKTGGLNKHDIAACLTAQKVMATIGVDPKCAAQIMNIEKVVAQNGVPPVEIARVLQDGAMPAELIAALEAAVEPELGKALSGADVDCFVKLYDNIKLKANIPEDVIEFIDKKLIQVRCSLEDVADNMVGTKLAMGAKEAQVTRDLCETLRKTGASAEITCTTMHGALKKVVSKNDCDIMKDVGRAVVEDGNYPTDDVTKAMTEVCLNILEDDIQLREEAYKAMEAIMKDAGAFPTEIREYLDGALPPEPPRPPSPRLVAELERLRAEDEAREEEKARKALEGSSSSGEDFVDDGGKPKSGKPKNKMLDAVSSDSRRGSLVPPGSRRGSRQGSISLAGTERRGSYYGDDVSKRATVAVVVDGDKGKMNGEGGVINGQGGLITVTDPDGNLIQVAASSLPGVTGMAKNHGNLVTILSPEGKPIQVDANALQAAGVQNGIGNKVTVMSADGKPVQVDASTLQAAQNTQGASGTVTIMSPDGTPVQVNASALQAASAQNAVGNTVTVMSPDGKPIQVNASTLQAAAAQNAVGGMVTVMNAEGKPVQVPAGALQAANVQNHIGDMVTIMSPDGKPVQVSASSLQAAGLQNQNGGLITVVGSDGKPTQVPASSLGQLGGAIGGAASSSLGGAGGLVTVINSDGKPTQVPASSLNMSGGLQGGAAGFSSSSSITAGGLVTITGQDGKPVQVPANILQTQMQSSITSGGIVTVIGQDGKPSQIPASSLNMATTPNLPFETFTSNLGAAGGFVTIMGQDGKPIQISASDLQSGATLKGGLVTILGSDGKPKQVPANSLSMPQSLNALPGLATTASNLGTSTAWNDPHQFAAMAAAAANNMENLEMLSSLLESGLGPEAVESPEEARKALLAKIRSEGMSEDDVAKLMSVFDNQVSEYQTYASSGAGAGVTFSQFMSSSSLASRFDGFSNLTPIDETLHEQRGVLTKIGGVRKFRKISDVNSTVSGVDKAFGAAIEGAQRQSKKSTGAGLSDENRKLMESILAKSVKDQYEIGSRVATLLAGTSLTTTAGVDIKRRDPVEEIGYETVDGLGKLTKKRVDTYVAPRKIEIPKVTVQDIPRPSIQRQSQSLHRLRKLSEQQREADKKREEEKRITGLRRAKVPLMVYSCGGFTRCFRIARFYDVDGPPIGIKYDAESRAALNPDVNFSSVAADKSEES